MTPTTPKAAIVAAARTAIGTARRGTLVDVDARELAKPVVSAAIERSGLEPSEFEDLVLAEVLQGGGDIARYVAVDLGLTGVAGMAVNRQCASSLTAVAVAAAQIAAGMNTTVLAGGTASHSTSPIARKRKPFTSGKEPADYDDPWMSLSHPPTPDAPAVDMSITVAHNCAVQYGISRTAQDEWALRSHQRAVKAIDGGSFAEEIVPVTVSGPDGSTVIFDSDEHPRRESSMEILSGLKVLHPEIDGFSVTAGNSSGLNDAAAVVALTRPDTEADVLAHVLSWSAVGMEPNRTGSGPIYAIPKALDLAELTIEDVALFEINEAFAAQAVACTRELGLDEEIVNVYGSGISLGHPSPPRGPGW
jgi:acetyl-CoA acyltransferase